MPSKKHMVMCRCCRQRFDIGTDPDGNTWIMPSKNFYYHKNCYNDWLNKKDDIHAMAEDAMWFDCLKEYLARDLKMGINYEKLTSQWKNLLKQGKTAKGIYFTIRYFYDIKKNDPQKSDGIGIVSFIYEEGCTYWKNREEHDRGLIARLTEQTKQAATRQKETVVRTQKKKINKTIDLADIAAMEDVE